VDNNSARTCGLSCDFPCTTIRGGTATCDGVRCGVACPAGQKPCVDACIPESEACGGGGCPAGRISCNSLCVDPKSPSSCGPACVPCSSPGTNGQPICDGEKCDVSCNAGHHKCGTTCASETDPEKCGDSYTTCTAPADAKPVCRNGGCDFDCLVGVKCGDRCIGRDQPCNDVCPTGTRTCGGRCVPAGEGSCCGDADCGACKSCQSFRCQPTTSGQQDPQCSGPCRVCQNGACSSRPTTTTCSPRTCNGSTVVEGRCSDGECAPQNVQDCATAPTCSGGSVLQGRCTAGQCEQQLIQACPTGRSCSGGNVVEGRCNAGQCQQPTVQTCTSCETCNAGRCDPRDCGPGRRCQNGTCMDTCGPGNGCPATCTPDNDPDCKRENGSQCSTGTQCRTGNCADGTCCNTACNDGCSRCDGGTCRSTCANGQRCTNRQCCDSRQGQSCDVGNECQTGTIDCAGNCQPKAKSNGTNCGATRCPAKHCQDGQCVFGAVNSCPAGQVCSEGHGCILSGLRSKERLSNGTPYAARCMSCGGTFEVCCPGRSCRVAGDVCLQTFGEYCGAPAPPADNSACENLYYK
jgi:hypothetical protein